MEYAPGSESAAVTGDYIGVESCIDLRNDEEFEAYARDCERSYARRHRKRETVAVGEGGRRRSTREVREFPPPLTYLARTENQPSHMPWVMSRYYTSDGRLVIREEKVRHHEYFRAHRADGRLTLQLIPLDSCCDDVENDNVEDVSQESMQLSTLESGDGRENVDDEVDVEYETEKEKEEAISDVVNDAREEALASVVEEEVAARVMVSSVSMAALCISEGVRSGGMLTSASSSCLTPTGGGAGKKCFGFNSLRSSSASSLFHLQVPAIRPVIS